MKKNSIIEERAGAADGASKRMTLLGKLFMVRDSSIWPASASIVRLSSPNDVKELCANTMDADW